MSSVHLQPVHRLLRRPLMFLCLGIIAGVIFAALAAPLLTSHAAEGLGEPNPANKFLPPSSEFVFGTDHLGRDLFARVLFGGRSSLAMGIIVVAFAFGMGALVGLIAGYFGGWLDEIVMRITDVFLAFPSLLLAIAIASAIGASFVSAIVAIGLTWWPWYARLARAQVITLRHREYVLASHAVGASNLRILFTHILPNALTPLIIQATSDIGAAILTGAALSFLGLGVQPPAADWGQMVSAGRLYYPDRWWYVFFPGCAIFLVALAFGLLGDGLHDALTMQRSAPRHYDASAN